MVAREDGRVVPSHELALHVVVDRTAVRAPWTFVWMVFLAVVLSIASTPMAIAACKIPDYRLGDVLVDSPSKVIANISIRWDDFAPSRLVCLAEALKEHYPNRRTVDVWIFSSRIAARSFRIYEPARYWARDLHAMYSYDPDEKREYIEIKPIGLLGGSPTDTRFDLPASGPLHCRAELDGRCMLNMEYPLYPVNAYLQKWSGTIVLAGTVARDGTVKRVELVDSGDLGAEQKDVFVRDATEQIRSWRFQRSSRESTFRTTYTYRIDPSLRPLNMETRLSPPFEITVLMNPGP
jgi:hypothetical protein